MDQISIFDFIPKQIEIKRSEKTMPDDTLEEILEELAMLKSYDLEKGKKWGWNQAEVIGIVLRHRSK